MSVEETNKVDFLVVDGSGKILLVIADHLTWHEPLEHLYVLQEKINTYAGFVESGQVWEEASTKARRYIPAGSTQIEIMVFLEHDPPEVFQEFLVRARHVFVTIGVSLNYEVRPD